MEANDKRPVIRNLVKHLNKGCPCERPQGARQSPKSSGFAIIEEIATSPSAPRNDILFNQIWYHLAFANNQEHLLRNLSEERRRIRQHLERAQQDDLCEFVIYPDVTPNEIFDVFQEARYSDRIAIFHYAGHATSYRLLLEEGKLRAGGLAAFLGEQQGLHLVFLNACATEPQVQEIQQAGVPAVIATSFGEPDGSLEQGKAGGSAERNGSDYG